MLFETGSIMRTIALCLLVLGCGGQTTSDHPAAGGTGGAGGAGGTGSDWVVGGPCLVNPIGNCEVHVCYGTDGGVETVSKLPANDAGPDACEGVSWP